jgi:hypothetical protein
MAHINKNRNCKNPLWPHHNYTHPDYRNARSGEIAFTLVHDPSDPSIAGFSDPAFTQLGSFDPEINSIKYFTCMNSFGELPVNSPDVDKLQLEWRSKISPIGIVVSDVENAENLRDLGNTVMAGKGKKTMPNTGNFNIHAGVEVSADIPLTSEYHSYGLSKIPDYETDRYSLLTVPTQTVDSTLETVRDVLFDQFRSGPHTEAVIRFYRGCMGVSSVIQAYAMQEDYTSAKAAHIGAASQNVYALLNKPSITSAILSLDPDTDGQLFDQVAALDGKTAIATTNPGYQAGAYAPYYDKTDSKAKLQNYIQKATSHRYVGGTAVFGTSGPLNGVSVDADTKTALQELFSQMLEYSIFNVVKSISEIVDISQRLKIGKAMTPAPPGQDFDLMLGI